MKIKYVIFVHANFGSYLEGEFDNKEQALKVFEELTELHRAHGDIVYLTSLINKSTAEVPVNGREN